MASRATTTEGPHDLPTTTARSAWSAKPINLGTPKPCKGGAHFRKTHAEASMLELRAPTATREPMNRNAHDEEVGRFVQQEPGTQWRST